MTRLHDAIAALVDPGEESLLRDQPSIRARRAELDKEHRAHIAYLRERHDAARAAAAAAKSRSLAARNAAGMRRAITAMTEAGQAHRARRDALSATTGATPSLLDQLIDAVHSTAGTGNGSRGVHRSVLNSAAVELLHDIARTVHCDQHQHLEYSIRYWADKHDDPGPAALIVTSWTATARGILDPPRSLEGTGPCPACGERWVWADDGDERIRKSAIHMVITGRTADDYAECRNQRCAHRWPRTHWDLLAAAMRAG